MPDLSISRFTPAGIDRTIERILADERRRWREGRGRPVEECLAERRQLESDDEAVLALLYQEVVLRQEAGQSPHVDEYVARFPRLAEAIAAQFEVDQALDGSIFSQNAATTQTLAAAPTAGDRVATDSPLPAVAGYEVLELLGHGGMG